MKTAPSLSALQRNATFNSLDNQHFDLLIVGGGITGAGIALDAASRGLSTALFEMQDFAAGTSSRSTKLIHGGLRYLKQLEISLVREVGQERAIIYQNAPHIVRPRQMLLPIIREGSLGKYGTSVGLYVYDFLAGVDSKERRTMHTPEEVTAMEPLLRTDILEGGGLYWEYQTDDARLTIEVLKTAAEYGNQAINYATVSGFHYNEAGKMTGIKVTDLLTNRSINVYGKAIINAAGPWVDDVRSKDDVVRGKHLQLTKGVHLVFAYKRLPLKEAVYFDVKDGRMIFAIPKDNTTYVGTTDTHYHDQTERPQVTPDDVVYLLDALNDMFPTVKLTVKDIKSSWAGLRPLIHEEGKSPSELSRKDEIFVSKSGLFSMAGGKLTGFRKMAERVVDEVVKKLYKEQARPIEVCSTDTITFSGGNFKHPDKIPAYISTLVTKYTADQFNTAQIAALVYKYGSNTEIICQLYDDLATQHPRLSPNKRLLLAELHYGIQYEMVTNLCDFLIRRTGRLYFERETLEDIYFLLLDELAKVLGINKQTQLQYLHDFEKEYEAVVSFKKEMIVDNNE